MTELIELMGPLELVEWKEEMTGTDGLVGIDGNFKANGIDRIETVELTELMEFIEWWHGNYGKMVWII